MNAKLCSIAIACTLMLAACGGSDDSSHQAGGGTDNGNTPVQPAPEPAGYTAMCHSAITATSATATSGPASSTQTLAATEAKLMYQANFAASSGLPDGWSVVSAPNVANKSDVVHVDSGALVLNGRAHSTQMTTLALPAALDNTENFRMEVEFTLQNANDSNRWGSLMYRTTPGANKHPYFQFAIRQNATAGNGTEFAQRTAADAWSVTASKPFSEAIDASKTYHATVVVHGNRVRQYLNNVLLEDVTLPEGARSSGGFGLSTAGVELRVSTLRIYEQNEALPDIAEPIVVREVATQAAMAPTIAQAVASAASLDRTNPSQHLFCLDSGLQLNAGDQAGIGSLQAYLADAARDTLALVYVSDEATANALISQSKSLDLSDITLVSDNANLLRSIRQAIPNSRAALDLTRRTLEATSAGVVSAVDETNQALAKIAILPPSLVTRDSVEHMQKLLITPWAASDTEETKQAAAILTTGVNGVLARHPEAFTQVLAMLPTNTLLRNPLLIGHRGIPGFSDENTLEGAKLAIQLGGTSVENDIYKTTDNHLVIMHDDNVDRTTNGKGAIESMSLAEVRQLRTNRGYQVPTLMEFFDTFKDQPMTHVVEIKSGTPEVVDLLAKEMEAAGVRDQVVTISFNTAQIARMKNLLPGVSVGYLSNGSSKLKDILEATQSYSTTYNPAYGSLSRPIMAAAKHRGVTFWPWTVNDQYAFADLYTQGVGGITTDHLDWARSYARKIELVEELAPASVGKQMTLPQIRVTDSEGKVALTYPSYVLVLPGSLDSTGSGSRTVAFSKAGTASVLLGYTYPIPGTASVYNLVTAPMDVTVQ